jgi:crotonobetainyl-CoA:carnitine CoA-transferase CaiB-like acyl-CoA transferase
VLGPYRVLDCTDQRGWFASFLLAQLGADVVLVEPEGGWPRTYHHTSYNRGKRSVIASGVDEIAALAADADLIIDCGAWPSALDLDALRAANPGLITVRITPWGETGPKATWRATDLTLFASSGQMAVTGDSDRAPVRISVPQAWLHAASEAAVGAMVALEHRARTGVGQHVDCSAQQAVVETALSAVLYAPAGLLPVTREAGGVRFGPVLIRTVYPCLDGYVVITIAFGAMIGPMFRRFMNWLHEEGFVDKATRDKNWVDFALHIQSGQESLDELDRIMEVVGRFAATKTKGEILERGLRDGLLVCPVNDIDDLLASPQLDARGFWEVTDGLKLPGPVVLASATPLAPTSAAPEAGQHTGQVALDPSVATLRAARATVPAGADPAKPLAGLKVCDLAWVAAAPLATKILAHWGATVVRVESVNRPCLLRQALGHRDDVPEQENAIAWHSTNANKLALSLDLSKPEARAVVGDLVGWADLVTESFTPGTMARWGLGYEDLVAIKPDIVMLSSCVMGQTGPYRHFAGFGNMAASIAGFFDITGWADRGPAGPYLAYTDYVSPRFTVCALLAAIDHHRRTGQGQHLDYSQMEAAIHFLAPALVERQVAGTKRTRRGNLDDHMVPHGVYPGLGTDQWIAVAVEGDEQWRSLAIEMRRADLADLGTAARREREAELDELVTAWTSGQDVTGLQHRLQAHGIAAHQVQNSAAAVDDAQLMHRGHFQWVPHPHVRQALVDTMPYTLSAAPGGFSWAGPTYGQHTMDVLEGLLGYDGERIAALAIAEALE